MLRESAGCGVEELLVTHKPSQLLVFLFLNTRTPPPPPKIIIKPAHLVKRLECATPIIMVSIPAIWIG